MSEYSAELLSAFRDVVDRVLNLNLDAGDGDNDEHLTVELGGAEKVTELREAFELYDKDGDGTINARELAPLLRSVGQYPEQEELQDMIEVRYIFYIGHDRI